MLSRDIYVLRYGTTRWGWKFETGPVQKTYESKEEAMYYALQLAKRYESQVYCQNNKGKFERVKT